MKKSDINKIIDAEKTKLFNINQYILENPELGYEEYKASKILSNELHQSGFDIEFPFCGLDTCFKAVYERNENGPTIGLLCEYDALKGIGHACGHNLQGPTIIGAAKAIKEMLKIYPGKLIIYGTPAEETFGAKIKMAKEYVFDELDVALMFHAGDRTCCDNKSLALNLVDFIFHGKSSHAAIAPHKGRSALDAVIQMFNGIEYLREHIPTEARIHGIISDGGVAANIVPERAVAQFYVRANTRRILDEIFERVCKVAKGAALMTETDIEIKILKSYDNKINVQSLNDLLIRNAKVLNINGITPPREFTGSTDFSNVSYRVPSSCFRIKIAPLNTPSHSKDFLNYVDSESGRDSIISGAKVIAGAVYDILINNELLAIIKKDFKESKICDE